MEMGEATQKPHSAASEASWRRFTQGPRYVFPPARSRPRPRLTVEVCGVQEIRRRVLRSYDGDWQAADTRRPTKAPVRRRAADGSVPSPRAEALARTARYEFPWWMLHANQTSGTQTEVRGNGWMERSEARTGFQADGFGTPREGSRYTDGLEPSARLRARKAIMRPYGDEDEAGGSVGVGVGDGFVDASEEDLINGERPYAYHDVPPRFGDGCPVPRFVSEMTSKGRAMREKGKRGRRRKGRRRGRRASASQEGPLRVEWVRKYEWNFTPDRPCELGPLCRAVGEADAGEAGEADESHLIHNRFVCTCRKGSSCPFALDRRYGICVPHLDEGGNTGADTRLQTLAWLASAPDVVQAEVLADCGFEADVLTNEMHNLWMQFHLEERRIARATVDRESRPTRILARSSRSKASVRTVLSGEGEHVTRASDDSYESYESDEAAPEAAALPTTPYGRLRAEGRTYVPDGVGAHRQRTPAVTP